jgi:hypothetical protein
MPNRNVKMSLISYTRVLYQLGDWNRHPNVFAFSNYEAARSFSSNSLGDNHEVWLCEAESIRNPPQWIIDPSYFAWRLAAPDEENTSYRMEALTVMVKEFWKDPDNNCASLFDIARRLPPPGTVLCDAFRFKELAWRCIEGVCESAL